MINQKKFYAYDFNEDEMIHNLVNIINNYKSDSLYISGFSQTLYHISKKIKELQLKIIKQIDIVHPNSEGITIEQRKIIKSSFNCRFVPMVYGSTEGHFASECKEGIMHINMKNGMQ